MPSLKNRIKGRDLYDYIFYLSRDASLNVNHLKARLVQSSAWDVAVPFSLEDAKCLLCDRFDAIDYSQAKEDVRPFVKNLSSLDLWSAAFFKRSTGRLRLI